MVDAMGQAEGATYDCLVAARPLMEALKLRLANGAHWPVDFRREVTMVGTLTRWPPCAGRIRGCATSSACRMPWHVSRTTA
jgi:hypothetical protein